MPMTPESSPQSREELLRVIQARDAELSLLKLMIQKLQLQLARRNRVQFGSTSERFEGVQGTLLEAQPLYELQARTAAAKPAANAPQIDRSLPAHLPREDHVHRPQATAAHHDASGQACGCTACGGRLRLIGQEVSEQLEYVPARFKVIRHVRLRWCSDSFEIKCDSGQTVTATFAKDCCDREVMAWRAWEGRSGEASRLRLGSNLSAARQEPAMLPTRR